MNGTEFALDARDPRYPAALAALPDAPERLFGIGDAGLLAEPKLAICGPRQHSAYGRECAERFARLAAGEGLVLVTGGDIGIEAFALRACLEAGGRAVTVVPHGLGRAFWPEQSRECIELSLERGGLVLTRAAHGMPVRPGTRRWQAMLVADVSDAMIVCEARLPSGILDMADRMLSRDGRLYAVPGSILSDSSRGANQLIRAGARIMAEDADISELACELWAMGCR